MGAFAMAELVDPTEADATARDLWLDEALEESFPASDPIAVGRRPVSGDDV
jgi:hypothetical protein